MGSNKKYYRTIQGVRYNCCPKCNTFKHPDDFHNSLFSVDGIASYCKVCASAYQKKWKNDNPDKVETYTYPKNPNIKPYRITNTVEWKAYINSYMNKRRKNDPQFRMRANLATLVRENLKLGKIIRPDHCSECNIPTDKAKASFNYELIIQLLEVNKLRAIHFNDIENKIVWKCSKCVVKRK